ncbi:MAG TPA: RluA family pseudouridine synthase, partial [Clostridia bacterium]|nr:RluA family pseudouridine synthase [Clostridia bacterium]
KETLHTIPPELDNERADKAIISLLPTLSRSFIQQLIKDGAVTVDGKKISKNRLVKNGEIFKVILPQINALITEAEDLPLDIVYEDDDFLVVNKQKGMVVHPAAGNFSGTLVNALLYHRGGNLSTVNGDKRPGIVHRLDKDTSGLLIVAKNNTAHENLAQQIKEHTLKREYRAVVIGNIKDDSGTIDLPLGRSSKDRKKRAVKTTGAKNAVTHFEVLERFNGYTYVKLNLETGRTHQIRVHMSYRGNPVAGDTVYGGRKNRCGLLGQCLHASLIGFNHPRTGEYIEIESVLPEYFLDFLRRIR